MTRRPFRTLTFAAIAAGCMLLTHSIALQRGRESSSRLKPEPRAAARMTPGPRISPFRIGPLSARADAGPGGPPAMPEPASARRPAFTNPLRRPAAPAEISIQHDPIVLIVGKPAQIQILLARAAATDTAVDLTAESAAVSRPKSITIPAGRVLAGIRLVPSMAGEVRLTATTTDSQGRKITSHSNLSIQAIDNNGEDR